MQRMGRGSYRVTVDADRTYLRLLGTLRPLVGGVFAAFAYFAIQGKLFAITIGATDTQRFFAYTAIGFLMGFNERWAHDVLSAARAHVGGNSHSKNEATEEADAEGREQLEPK